MRVIFLREFIVATRRAPFIACLVVHLTIVSAFLLLWPAGVPLMRGSLYEQARWLDAAVLVCVLSWASIRLAATSDANTRARLAVLTGASPSAIALGSVLAIAASLALITLTGLPVLLRASQLAAEPWTRAAWDEMTLLTLACAVAAVGAAAGICGDRVARWLLATALTLLLSAVMPRIVHGSLAVAGVFVGIAVVVGLLVVRRAKASGRYVVEQRV